MKQVTHTQAFLRKRKMLLVFPLLVLPFITLAFWALGGGKTVGGVSSAGHQGLNLQLPGSQLKEDSTLTKLSFYEKARSDSEKRREWMRSDPYYDHMDTGDWWSRERELNPSSIQPTKYSGYDPVSLNPSPYDRGVASAENKVMEKLTQLNQVIEDGEQPDHVGEKERISSLNGSIGNPNFGGDVDRLEAMMQSVSSKGEDDPELRQLSSLMDKIMDVQHPERVKERTRYTSMEQKEALFPVEVEQPTVSISLLGDTINRATKAQVSSFYGLEDNYVVRDAQISVLASIHGSQTLSSGSVVKLRLEQNIYVGGEPIPKGSFIYGTAEMNGERLHISISTIRSGITILPVKLQLYDLDGIAGIYMPGSKQREVVQNSADNAIQGLELSTIDPSLKAQAASAGISAAKNLLSRKVKVEKVTLKGGYQVILQSM